MIICGTGHRPNKIGGYGDAAHKKLIRVAEDYLWKLHPEKVISGMALGWDTALAEAVLNINIMQPDMNISLVCAVPFQGQEIMWIPESQIKYKKILGLANEIKYVSPPGYEIYKMQVRNEWMVDNSDMVLAIWDGSKGGTYNCIQYAKRKNREIINVYEAWVKYPMN